MTKRQQHCRKYVYAERDQLLLMPPDLREWLAEDHVSRFFVRLVESLDLTDFYESYETDPADRRGRPPLDPALMLSLILYCMSQKEYSARGMERMTYNDVGARFVAGNHHPDHCSIAKFRIRHADGIKGVFAKVLFLCEKAGLVDLLHVAIDSTVVLADASRSKSVEAEKMDELLKLCQKRAQALLERLNDADEKEEKTLKSKLRKQQLQEQHLKDAMAYLQKRDEENRKLEKEMKAKRDDALDEFHKSRVLLGAIIKRHRNEKSWSLKTLSSKCRIDWRRISDLENGKKPLSADERSRLARVFEIEESELPLPIEKPSIEALEKMANPKRINLIDRDSYLLFRNSQGYRQGFLAQAATDSKSQIILATEISVSNDDHPALPSLLLEVERQFGRLPEVASADTGYASEAIFSDTRFKSVALYVKTQKTATPPKNPLPRTDEMRAKLETDEGKEIYKCRAKTVEPPFGQIKFDRGFTRFLRSGHQKAAIDWLQVCTVHNILKLFSLARWVLA